MPMPGSPLSPAGQQLGLLGDLAGQGSTETDEERKRRLAQLQQQQQRVSPAMQSILGYRI